MSYGLNEYKQISLVSVYFTESVLSPPRKDSDYKKHIINLIKKRKPAPDRLPLQSYRITYLQYRFYR